MWYMWFSCFQGISFSSEMNKNPDCTVLQVTSIEISDDYKKAMCWQHHNYEQMLCESTLGERKIYLT